MGDSSCCNELFSADSPCFRKTPRVLDVLAYHDPGLPGVGFKDWILTPGITSGENPLFLNPAILAQACCGWRNREDSGEWVDRMFRMQPVPPLSREEMADNAFPAGVPVGRRDERLISNFHGARVGRGREVTGFHLYFSQAIAPDVFMNQDSTPRSWEESPIRVQVLSSPTDDPVQVRPEPFTLVFVNRSDVHASHVSLTFKKPVRKGWIRITINTAAVRGMTGERLEGNVGEEFVYLWPVMINASKCLSGV